MEKETSGEEISSKYEMLRKKHKLPEFQALDREFDISKIDDSGSLLKEVRMAVAEKVQKVCDLLEEMLQPDASISNLYESRFLDDELKTTLFELYRQLMIIKRHSDALFIMNDDKEDAAFITETYEMWLKSKPGLASIFNGLKDGWGRETDIPDKLQYMG